MAQAETKPLQICISQINNSFSGQNYLPYSAGLLEAYVRKHAKRPERYAFREPLYKRMPVEQAVEQMLPADVYAFSLYVWNERISLEVARRLKERRPEALVICGGPQVPDRAEAFLREHRFVDLAVHGEGEAVFLRVLEALPARAWDGIGSLSYLDAEGAFVAQPRAPRFKDISEIPSPYLEGTFNPLMRSHPGERWLLLWETNRGCPFACTFCDWGSATGDRVSRFEIERLYREVDWAAERKIEFIFCCDANYGMLPRDVDISRYVAEVKRRKGYPHALSVQNTKNSTERAYLVQRILADAGLNKGVTISLQSVDTATLKAIKRDNISSKSFEELQRRFTRDRIETYSDMILGMPDETYDSFADGIAHVIDIGQHNRIQFNNLSILPNAEMGDPDYQARYGMEIVRTKIINIHGSLLASEDGIQEFQELVIATTAMPRRDWVRTRAFCWMTALLHFDKILQIPLVLMRELGGVSYRELVELFTEGDVSAYPTLRYLREFFSEKARDIQNGGEEYCRSEEWLNIYWPADELALIHLCTQNRLANFYEEAEQVLLARAAGCAALPPELLTAAVELNHRLVKLPFQTEDTGMECPFNVWEFYRSVLEGRRIPLERRASHYHIDRTGVTYGTWEEWCQQVIWYGNKKGAYLYSNSAVEPQLDGHF